MSGGIKYSKDGLVAFDPIKHTYTKDGKVLQGVTGLISRFKNKFDADGTAERLAPQRGTTKEALLKEWSDKGEASRLNGTAVHSVFESYIETGRIVTSQTYKKELVAAKFIAEMFMTDRLIPVDCECIVYNDFIASQVDMVAKNDRGDHFILDWKTNERIETNGYGKSMFGPFYNLPDASFFHYSIQVQIYKHLYREHPIKDLYIVHIMEDNYKIIKAADIEIPEQILNYV